MSAPIDVLLGIIGSLTIALLVVLVARPSLADGTGGKVLAFVALFILPISLTGIGTTIHLERSTSTGFCLSCHIMEPYGESLLIDDSEYLPASHYQNHRVSREHACFDCHTSYTMYGDLAAKMRGLKHVWVQYLGTPPERPELYGPYLNRECLHCHAGARSFEESPMHEDLLPELVSEATSCLECHAFNHGIDELDDLARWRGADS